MASSASKRAVAFLRRSLKPAGLDVVIPLTLERYNAFLEQDPTAASDLTRFILPTPTNSVQEKGAFNDEPTATSPTSCSSTNSNPSATTPTTPTPPTTPTTPTNTKPTPTPPLKSHLLVLVGNSRALWEPFLDHIAEEIKREGRVLADPIDRYVKHSVERVLAMCEAEQVPPPAKTYWVADTEPGKMILAQKMALAARAVTRCAPSQICLHPVFGPWLAFRCALVFPLEGIPEEEEEEEAETNGGAEINGGAELNGGAEIKNEKEEQDEDVEVDLDEPLVPRPQPAECAHDDTLHELLATQMERALDQVTTTSDTPFPEIRPDAWKAWVLPRLTVSARHPHAYASEQILYHYTKDLAYLANVVRARQRSLCTDYLRDPPPRAAQELRELLQTVLREWTLVYPGGLDAIALSGGLDTSVLAEASAQPWQSEYGDGVLHLDKRGAAKPILSFRHAFTVRADARAQDAAYARAIFARLEGVSIEQQHVVERSLEELLAHAPRVAKLLATCDPMELRNSLVIYAMLHEAARRGVRQLVTGDGADEIFCGYAFYAGMDEPRMLAYRDQIMDVMGFTAPTLARALGIDVIAPFLDKRVLAFARTLRKHELVGERTPVPVDGPDVRFGKLALRQAFPESYSQWRDKQPIEQGAGTTALRTGHFDDYCSLDEFDAAQRGALREHGVLVRDKEHLFFFRAFLEAFGGDLANVPKARRLAAVVRVAAAANDEGEEEEEEEEPVQGFCPACGFELSHAAQDFCVTCGFWPTCATPTNDSQGFASQALAQLRADKLRLLRAARAE